ncbi:DCAF8 [Branchiostoma lanceolatum]|uniref:DCAF8 protein n=1 Tax=Branchiostoma lanceolatum TaxID=7740 RepID=A0A8J9ZRJ9_BRALA|nr:DCAF8 [Branchiostoma lanceolatum]
MADPKSKPSDTHPNSRETAHGNHDICPGAEGNHTIAAEDVKDVLETSSGIDVSMENSEDTSIGAETLGEKSSESDSLIDSPLAEKGAKGKKSKKVKAEGKGDGVEERMEKMEVEGEMETSSENKDEHAGPSGDGREAGGEDKSQDKVGETDSDLDIEDVEEAEDIELGLLDDAKKGSGDDSGSDVVVTRPTRSKRHDEDDSDTEDSDEEKVEDDKKESEDEGDTTWYSLDDRKIPFPKWKVLPSLHQREMGFGRALFPYYACGLTDFVSRFELQHKLEHHEGCVNTLHFNQPGTLLASGSDDLNVVLWDWARNKPVLIYNSGHRSNVFQAKFMPYSGDCTVVSCARDGQVRVAELSSTGVCKGTKKLAQHRGAAHKLALDPDSNCTFLTCGEDAVVFQIDLRDDKPATKLLTTKENDRKLALYTIFTNPVNSHEFSVGGRDHWVRVFDKRKINPETNEGVLKKFCPHHLVDSDIKANITCLVYNHDGSELLASYNDEDIYLFDPTHSDGADFIKRFRGHRNNATVKGVNFYGPQSEMVVSGSDCGHIYLWEKETANIVQFLEGDDGGVVNCLEPHPCSAVLATSGLDHDVKVWAPTAKEPTNLEGLKTTVKTNKKERDEENRHNPEMIDGHMLWFLMHHLRRRARRRAREAGEEEASDSEDSSSPSSDSDSDGPSESIQCAPS